LDSNEMVTLYNITFLELTKVNSCCRIVSLVIQHLQINFRLSLIFILSLVNVR